MDQENSKCCPLTFGTPKMYFIQEQITGNYPPKEIEHILSCLLSRSHHYIAGTVSKERVKNCILRK